MFRCRELRLVPVLLAASAAPALSQDATVVQRLRALPGYERYEAVTSRLPAAMASGAVEAEWAVDSTAFDFSLRGRRWRFDMATRLTSELPVDATAEGPPRSWRDPGRRAAPDANTAESPDGRFRAVTTGDTLRLHERLSAAARTIAGDPTSGVTYGRAPAVYATLNQRDGMWWSPDSRWLAYLRVRPRREANGRPAGPADTRHNESEATRQARRAPIVDVLVYDVETRSSTQLAVRRAGNDFDEGLGYYVHRIGWSPGGGLMLRRLNRLQNQMELAVCAPATGACRTVLTERSAAGWVSDAGEIRWLADGKRFVWKSERAGFSNLYLYASDGRLLATLTRHAFAVEDLIAVDESTRTVFYTARDGDNFMKVQLHRVELDGTKDVRLTDPAFHHLLRLSPDCRYFVDVFQAHATAPATRVGDARTGVVLAEIARSDLSGLTRLGLKPVELFRYMSSDGVTELFGTIQYPSTFDPSRTYPALVSLYNAPDSSAHAVTERFTVPHPTTEFGFLVVTLDTRSTPGRGRRPLDAVYRRLGLADVDDLAQGIRALAGRAFVDRARIGVYGTSYGGYAATMLLLRHPDLVAAAVASSPVTVWERYDDIYTERYMGKATGNPDAYRRASPIAHAPQLRGRLLLFYGTHDQNVLPEHSQALIDALDAAGKHVDVEVGAGQDHTSIGHARLLLFFAEHLAGPRPALQQPPS